MITSENGFDKSDLFEPQGLELTKTSLFSNDGNPFPASKTQKLSTNFYKRFENWIKTNNTLENSFSPSKNSENVSKTLPILSPGLDRYCTSPDLTSTKTSSRTISPKKKKDSMSLDAFSKSKLLLSPAGKLPGLPLALTPSSKFSPKESPNSKFLPSQILSQISDYYSPKKSIFTPHNENQKNGNFTATPKSGSMTKTSSSTFSWNKKQTTQEPEESHDIAELFKIRDANAQLIKKNSNPFLEAFRPPRDKLKEISPFDGGKSSYTQELKTKLYATGSIRPDLGNSSSPLSPFLLESTTNPNGKDGSIGANFKGTYFFYGNSGYTLRNNRNKSEKEFCLKPITDEERIEAAEQENSFIRGLLPTCSDMKPESMPQKQYNDSPKPKNKNNKKNKKKQKLLAFEVKNIIPEKITENTVYRLHHSNSKSAPPATFFVGSNKDNEKEKSPDKLSSPKQQLSMQESIRQPVFAPPYINIENIAERFEPSQFGFKQALSPLRPRVKELEISPQSDKNNNEQQNSKPKRKYYFKTAEQMALLAKEKSPEAKEVLDLFGFINKVRFET